MRMKGRAAGAVSADETFDGRLEMARSLQKQHPDVARITRKWGRWQHQVDYRPFRKNRLRLRRGVKLQTGPDEFGMRLVKTTKAK